MGDFSFDISDIQLRHRAAEKSWSSVQRDESVLWSCHLSSFISEMSKPFYYRLLPGCCSINQTHTHCTRMYILPPFGSLSVSEFLSNLFKSTLNNSSSSLQSCALNSSFIVSAKRHSKIFTNSFPSQWGFPSAHGWLPNLEDNHLR